jgi:hypothetical protein
MWGPHVSDRGEKRRHGWKVQSKGGNTFSQGHQRHAGLVGRLGEAARVGLARGELGRLGWTHERIQMEV